MSESPNVRNEAQQIFSEATDFLAQQQKVRAEVRPPRPGFSRQRAVLAGLAVAVPVLVAVIVINFTERPFAFLLESRPSPAVAAQEAKRTLDELVVEVEAFRDDYDELPESLAEIGLPLLGEWSYALIDGGRYRIKGTLHGHAASYESEKRVERMAQEEP